MESLQRQGYAESLKAYIASGKPYMGICIGMQALFESSIEAPGVAGLGVVPGEVGKFAASESKTVPQMGWNTARSLRSDAATFGLTDGEGGTEQHFYFVHSYRAALDTTKHRDWALTTTQYGDDVFLSSVRKGNVFATQFHPEKSGRAGLEVLRAWLDHGSQMGRLASPSTSNSDSRHPPQLLVDLIEASRPRSTDGLTKRIVACLDVRSNDEGDVVVTKGESYDVREKVQTQVQQSASTSSDQRAVRNLGKPVDLAMRYYLEGADEVVFLNITSFRNSPLKDQPMLAVVAAAAESVFVPLTIGGGIKDSVDPDGTKHSARKVADEYFRAGADKVSIGSEAVLAVEELLARNGNKTGQTGIETISQAYGKQAVVVSIDPRRVYVDKEEQVDEKHRPSLIVVDDQNGGQKQWWYRCTIKGGREDRDIDVVQLAKGVEALGAGEILVNSIDQDGKGQGFDRHLIDLVRANVHIPVVASSGAGTPGHFQDIFQLKPLARTGEAGPTSDSPKPATSVEAALAAGVFHRKEMTIDQVKDHLVKAGFKVRRERTDQGAAKIVQDATARGVKAE